MTERILVLSHAHPDLSLGGGELAAHQLFQAYRARPEVEAAWFVGRVGGESDGGLRLRRPNEYLWAQSTRDTLFFRASNPNATLSVFGDLLRQIRPTVVHAHHYLHLGIEFLQVIKNVDPDIRIVMTLHELLAVCLHNGQMVKTDSFRLCDHESLDDCHKCFPEHAREQFWLRKRYLLKQFELVDAFVTPSEFLRQRYIDWGLAPERIRVIENGQQTSQPLAPRDEGPDFRPNRFAFFGQLNPYKGIDILLEALRLLPKKARKQLTVEVHGANIEWHDRRFAERIEALRAPLIDQGVLRWVGPYARADLPRRMAGIDWVVVPSIWWENSPMVIQEAFSLGRPVLCSNIGGMAEKVRHGVDGWHVEARNPQAWADTLRNMADDPELWHRLRAGITAPLDFDACAERHLRLPALSRNP